MIEKQQETWGVDFDATLAVYEPPYNPDAALGAPVPEMVRKVKAALADGVQIVIFTARVYPGESYERAADAMQSTMEIARWCQEVFGEVFPITCMKFPYITKIIDDRAEQVYPNTGVYVSELMEAQ